ncbi:hypothetical protein ACH5RR_000058 [Cinchona calisaya]|uniref:Uncharacterized protein n=1 Tax=Cinchona calisaya TaxID=153742 RepID=A0ABD3AZJ2_9GENT
MNWFDPERKRQPIHSSTSPPVLLRGKSSIDSVAYNPCVRGIKNSKTFVGSLSHQPPRQRIFNEEDRNPATKVRREREKEGGGSSSRRSKDAGDGEAKNVGGSRACRGCILPHRGHW